MKKKPIQPKKKEEKSAFSDLIKQVEKEKKKAKIVYSVGIAVLVLSLVMFLLFSPFKIPVFSQLGDRILGREEVVEVEETEEDIEVEEIEEEAEEVEEEEVEKVTAPAPTPTPTPQPTPEPTPAPTPKVYNCTDAEIEEWRAGIEQLEGYKAEADAQMSAYFFECFDRITSDYPYESEEWYQSKCWQIVCVDFDPELCTMPDEFQKGIDDFQEELNWCLSDR